MHGDDISVWNQQIMSYDLCTRRTFMLSTISFQIDIVLISTGLGLG